MEQLSSYHKQRRQEFDNNNEEYYYLSSELCRHPHLTTTTTNKSNLGLRQNVVVEEEEEEGCDDDDAADISSISTSISINGITRRNNNNKWMNLLFGQFIAFVATTQNVISFTLESKMGIVCPFFLMFPAYLILSLHLLFVVDVDVESRQPPPDAASESEVNTTATNNNNNNETTTSQYYKIPLTSIKIRVPFYYYLGLSILDVGPNYMILLALKRTSLTSVSLLGSLTIPSTMIACNFLLGQKFKFHHYIGVLCCLSGGIMTILGDSSSGSIHHSDTTNNNDNMLKNLQHSSHSLTGDGLAILAAILYGFTDALGEFWAKKIDRTEYLGMIGGLGALWTLLIFPFLEGDDIYHAFISNPSLPPVAIIVLLVIAYAIFLAGYYMSATLFMVKCDATLLNLSLQSSNLWAIIFSTVAFQDAPPSQFYLAVILVASGVCIYELCNGVTNNNNSTGLKILPHTSADMNTDTKYQSIPLCIRNGST